MRITLLTVGKTDVKWVKEGLDMYVSRLAHYVPFQVREIPELKNVSALSREQVKAREGVLVLKAVRPTDEVVLLDEGGREFRGLRRLAGGEGLQGFQGPGLRGRRRLRILPRRLFPCRFQAVAFEDDFPAPDG